VGAELGCQQGRRALDPREMRVAFGTGAREHRAPRLVGVDQLALFTLEGQPGALDLDDLVEPLRLGQRGGARGGARGDRGRATFVAPGGVEVRLDPGEALGHVDPSVAAHRQPLGHQLRDAPLGEPDAGGEGGLGLGPVEFRHDRPSRWRRNALRVPTYGSAQEEPPGGPRSGVPVR
jgi:hypothetical protein